MATNELTVRQLLEWTSKTGRHVFVFSGGDIFVGKGLAGGYHNLETLTETIRGAQLDPVEPLPTVAKPSWDDAPEWAQWLAQDENALWWWYASEPECGVNVWRSSGDHSEIAARGNRNPNWRETLERRPDADSHLNHIAEPSKMVEGEPIPVPEYGEADSAKTRTVTATLNVSCLHDALERSVSDSDEWPEERVDVIGQNGNDGLHYYPSTDVVPGYECLADVLSRALDQASRGKGKDRHAQEIPFERQHMQRLIGLYGTGFALGQAGKKAQESMRLPHDRAVAELLGAINYLAGAIIHMEQK